MTDIENDPQPSVDTTQSPLPAGLYLVATPIGNRGDITARALDILKRADLVACEDTRVTGNLMHLFGFKTRLTPYHDHNADTVRPKIMAAIRSGKAVALVSDAGMPLVSDPGYRLVRDCREEGLYVTAAPGPSAVPTALALSGLPTDRFLFAGFPPQKPGKLTSFCKELAGIPATLVLFEGVSRLSRTLETLAQTLGCRDAAICRELTKLHEEVRRGTLAQLAAFYDESGPPKGEVVIVIAPAQSRKDVSPDDLEGEIETLLATGMGVRQVAAHLSEKTGLSRRDLYQKVLTMQNNRE